MCSSVTAVGRMVSERRMMAKPWDPRNAQQFPGLTSGYKFGSKTPATLSTSVSFFFPPTLAWLFAWSNSKSPIKPPNPCKNQPSQSFPSARSHAKGAHLQDDTGGLRLVPQGDAEHTQQRCPHLIGLRAAGVDDTGPWHREGWQPVNQVSAPCDPFPRRAGLSQVGESSPPPTRRLQGIVNHPHAVLAVALQGLAHNVMHLLQWKQRM